MQSDFTHSEFHDDQEYCYISMGMVVWLDGLPYSYRNGRDRIHIAELNLVYYHALTQKFKHLTYWYRLPLAKELKEIITSLINALPHNIKAQYLLPHYLKYYSSFASCQVIEHDSFRTKN